MLKTASLTALALALTASSGFAEIMDTFEPSGIAGYTTVKLTVTGDLLGFNAATATFTGDMNQVLDYGSYIFLNPTFDNLFPELGAEDSFFLFEQPNLLVSASESSTHLAASFAFDEPVSADFPLAQIVSPTSVLTSMEGLLLKLDLAYPGVPEVRTLFWFIPTPASGSLFGIAGLAMLRRR